MQLPWVEPQILQDEILAEVIVDFFKPIQERKVSVVETKTKISELASQIPTHLSLPLRWV